MTKFKIWLLIWAIKPFYGYRKTSTKILFAQAKHETGNFTSEVYKQNKNLFGMRHPEKRKTLSKGSNLNHAVFKTHFASIVDYFLRQKYFKISNVDGEAYMLQTVHSNYAEDPQYLDKWRNVSNQTTTPVAFRVLIYGGLFFLLLILFSIIKRKK